MCENNHIDTPAVILAGGKSRRLGGGDKCMRLLAGKSLLQHVLERLQPQSTNIVLNANGNPDRFSAYNIPVIPDPIAGFLGPLAGVLAGMRWASNHSSASHFVTVAADTPFFPKNLISSLWQTQSRSGAQIVLSESQIAGQMPKPHPTFGLWPVALAEDLQSALLDGTRRIMEWCQKHRTAYAIFPTGINDNPFFNINSRQDELTAKDLYEQAMNKA